MQLSLLTALLSLSLGLARTDASPVAVSPERRTTLSPLPLCISFTSTCTSVCGRQTAIPTCLGVSLWQDVQLSLQCRCDLLRPVDQTAEVLARILPEAPKVITLTSTQSTTLRPTSYSTSVSTVYKQLDVPYTSIHDVTATEFATQTVLQPSSTQTNTASSPVTVQVFDVLTQSFTAVQRETPVQTETEVEPSSTATELQVQTSTVSLSQVQVILAALTQTSTAATVTVTPAGRRSEPALLARELSAAQRLSATWSSACQAYKRNKADVNQYKSSFSEVNGGFKLGCVGDGRDVAEAVLFGILSPLPNTTSSSTVQATFTSPLTIGIVETSTSFTPTVSYAASTSTRTVDTARPVTSVTVRSGLALETVTTPFNVYQTSFTSTTRMPVATSTTTLEEIDLTVVTVTSGVLTRSESSLTAVTSTSFTATSTSFVATEVVIETPTTTLAAPAAPAVSVNMFANPSFGERPYAWTQFTNGNLFACGSGGRSSGHIARTGVDTPYCNNVDPGIVSGMSQGINGLVPGAEYKITFWIFLLYGNRIPLLPLWGMASSSTIATYTGPQLPNAVWTQVESSFIAASATDTFSVFVDGSKIAPGVSGTFYIDNFDMYRL